MHAVNLACPAAAGFPVDDLLGDDEGEDEGPCGDLDFLGIPRPTLCRPISGFTCRVWDVSTGASNGFGGRCRRDRDPFEAIRFEYRFD